MPITREQIEQALALYEQGDVRGALEALPYVPGKSAEELEAELDRAAAAPHAPATCAAAVESWIARAVEAMAHDLGDDNTAFIPAPLALRTALALLDPPAPAAPPPEPITLSLRLQAALHAAMRGLASRHHRSLTAEIVVALEAYVAQSPME